MEQYLGKKLQPFKPLPKWEFKDYLGWDEQGDGKLFYGIYVQVRAHSPPARPRALCPWRLVAGSSPGPVESGRLREGLPPRRAGTARRTSQDALDQRAAWLVCACTPGW